MKNKIKLLGIIAMVALIVFSMTACGGDGDDEIVRPTLFDGYYGVTEDGESVEVIITPPASSSIRAINWGVTNNYVIRLDGTEKSRGTVAKSGNNLTFSPSGGGSTFVVDISDSEITITFTVGGTTIEAYIIPAADKYYVIGAGTFLTEAQIKSLLVSTKTPKGFYNYCTSNPSLFMDPDSTSGTFDQVVALGQSYDCPNSEFSRISKEMNSGKISGAGYYKHKELGNIVYFVSKLPLE